MEPPRRYTQLLLHYLLGSLITTSDNISDYDEDEMKTYLSQFPLIQPEIEDVQESRRTVTIKYRAGGRSFTSISNLAERIRQFELPEGKWFGAKGLRRRPHHVSGGRSQVLKPGESRNYMRLEDSDSFAGSDGHLFPGCEIVSIEINGNDFSITTNGTVHNGFQIWLRVPEDWDNKELRINGLPADILTTPYGDSLLTGTIGKETDNNGSESL